MGREGDPLFALLRFRPSARRERAVSGHLPGCPLAHRETGTVEPGSRRSAPWTCLPACQPFFALLSKPNDTFCLWRGAATSRHPPSHCMSLVLSMDPPLGFPPGGPWMAPRAKTSSVLQATTDTTTHATTSQATRRHRQGRLAGCLGRRARGRSVWWRLTVHMKFPSRPKQRDPPSRILLCRQSSRPKDGWVKSAPWIRKYLAWSCCSPCEPVTILCSCRSG